MPPASHAEQTGIWQQPCYKDSALIACSRIKEFIRDEHGTRGVCREGPKITITIRSWPSSADARYPCPDAAKIPIQSIRACSCRRPRSVRSRVLTVRTSNAWEPLNVIRIFGNSSLSNKAEILPDRK